MSHFTQCRCGEFVRLHEDGRSYDPIGTEHCCPAIQRDQSDRIRRLEAKVEALEQSFVALAKLLTLTVGGQRDGFREEAQRLIERLIDAVEGR